MKVAFLKGKGIVDRLIQIWTFSKYSHCEMIFSDGTTFGSSTAAPFKTEFATKQYPYSLWDVVEVPLTAEEESKVRDFCKDNVGKSYDWFAIFFSMILPFRIGSPDKFICSEVCVAAFQKANKFGGVKPHTVSPGKFAKMIK